MFKKDTIKADIIKIGLGFTLLFGSYVSIAESLDHFFNNYKFNSYWAMVPVLATGVALCNIKKFEEDDAEVAVSEGDEG